MDREALIEAVSASLPVFNSGPLLPQRAVGLALVSPFLDGRTFYDVLYLGKITDLEGPSEKLYPSPTYAILRDHGVTHEAVSQYIALLDAE